MPTDPTILSPETRSRPLLAVLRWIIIVVIVFALGGAAGFMLGKRKEDRIIVGVVNGSYISLRDLNLALAPYYDQVFEEVAEQRLIEAQARRIGVTVKDTELKVPPLTNRGLGTYYAMMARAKTEALWRKMVLKGAPPGELKNLYANFLPELKKYKIEVIALASKSQVEAYQDELHHGISFENLARKYSIDLSTKSVGGKLEFLTLGEIHQIMGPHAAYAVSHAKPGEILDPVASPLGSLAIRLVEVKESLQELTPDIERVIIGAHELQQSYELFAKANIVSDFVTLTAKTRPKFVPSQLEAPKASPSPLPLPKVNLEDPFIPPPSNTTTSNQPQTDMPKPTRISPERTAPGVLPTPKLEASPDPGYLPVPKNSP